MSELRFYHIVLRLIKKSCPEPSNNPSFQTLAHGRPSPPEAMMHSPLFQISPYFLRGKFSQFHLFPKKFLMTFFSYWFWILNSPFFFSTFPLFRENYYFPLLLQIPLDSVKFTCFLHTLCFSFPPSLTMMHLCAFWTPLHSPSQLPLDPKMAAVQFLGRLNKNCGLAWIFTASCRINGFPA